MNIKDLGLIVFGVLLNACGQLFLKKGSSVVTSVESYGWIIKIFRVLMNPFIVSGLAFYVLSVAVWIVALSRVSVSVAYPMLSIGYVVNLFAAWFFFGEPLSFNKILGVSVIVVGVIILARSQ